MSTFSRCKRAGLVALGLAVGQFWTFDGVNAGEEPDIVDMFLSDLDDGVTAGQPDGLSLADQMRLGSGGAGVPLFGFGRRVSRRINEETGEVEDGDIGTVGVGEDGVGTAGGDVHSPSSSQTGTGGQEGSNNRRLADSLPSSPTPVQRAVKAIYDLDAALKSLVGGVGAMVVEGPVAKAKSAAVKVKTEAVKQGEQLESIGGEAISQLKASISDFLTQVAHTHPKIFAEAVDMERRMEESMKLALAEYGQRMRGTISAAAEAASEVESAVTAKAHRIFGAASRKSEGAGSANGGEDGTGVGGSSGQHSSLE